MSVSTLARHKKNSMRQIGFFTLAGVSSAGIQEGTIVAVQKNPAPEFRAPKNRFFCEEFANWPSDAKGVLGFTKQFGLLREGVSPGPMVFEISDWQQMQNKIRSNWNFIAHVARTFSLGGGVPGQTCIPVDRGEGLISNGNKLEYQVSSLFRLAQMELASIRPERLRKCASPDCGTPYFVASHLGQLYCSAPCAQWAQREFKKNWWKAHGSSWRKKVRNEKRKSTMKAHGSSWRKKVKNEKRKSTMKSRTRGGR